MPARFKLDENLPRDAEALLRSIGHDVHTVLDEQLGGNPDPRVFDASQAEGRIVVTFDLDFSDIRVYPPTSHVGIWVLRPHTQSIANTLALLKAALLVLETEPTRDRLWIIEPERVRIREWLVISCLPFETDLRKRASPLASAAQWRRYASRTHRR